MQRNQGHNWGLWGLLLACLLVLGVNWRRLEQRLTETNREQLLTNPDIPPSLALTTQAVGPLRGLIANGLWWRAIRLQEEGNFFEAIQLANWISTLQPKLTRVWAYQSWNMAYNITAEIDDPEERWKWIQEGIHLLRNRGLRYNPRDAVISTEIGQIIMQKIGNDPQHSRYFQWRWAEEMLKYFPEGDRDELERLAAAPNSRQELFADPEIRALEEMAAAAGLDLLGGRLTEGSTAKEALNDRARELLADPDRKEGLQRIRDFRRKQAIRNELNMAPDHLLWIERKYGPLDWRLYQAHVIYWCAPESYDPFEDREDYHHAYVRQAMVQAFYDGKLLFMDERGLSTGTNLSIIESTHDYLTNYLNLNPYDHGAFGLAREFHEWAVILLYTNMYEAAAEEVFKDLHENFLTDDERKQYDLESFIAARAPVILRAPGHSRQERTLVVAALQQAYVWLAKGDAHRAAGYHRMANMMWNKNQKNYARNPDRLLPAMDELKKEVLNSLVNPESAVPPDIRGRLQALRGDMEVPEIKHPGQRELLAVPSFSGDHHQHDRPQIPPDGRQGTP